MEELTKAKEEIRKALERANESNSPIAELYEFTELVKEEFLTPKVYKKHMGIVVDMWNERRNAPPPTPPADANVRSSPDSGAGDVPRDNPNRLPVLDPKTKPDTLHIMPQTPNSKFAYATFKQSDTPGSYMGANVVQNNNLICREDGLVEVQWKLVEGRQLSADHRIPHTAFRVVGKEEAKSMNMDVDLVLGTDCQSELSSQVLVTEVRRASERLASVVEGEEHQALVMPAAGGPGLTQMPSTAQPGAFPFPISFVFNGPTSIYLPGASVSADSGGPREAMCQPGTTRCAASAASGIAAFGPPVMTATDGLKTSDGSQTKRKATDGHEVRPRNRTQAP